MTEPASKLEIAAAGREAFVLCLALGTLETIRSRAWPADAGIWTIARPMFHGPLEAAGISEVVLNVLRSADELSAIDEFVGAEELDRKLADWIAILQSRLSELTDHSWHARWIDTDAA